MKNFSIVSVVLSLMFGLTLYAASVPSIYLKNQYGEVSNNFVIGGSSQISAKFIVDSANSNGLGIRSLSASGGSDAISAIYMHTSSTPASGNPNPAAGYIIVKFAKGYTGYLSNGFSLGMPPSSTLSNVSGTLTVGAPYIIQTVGTTTATAWHTLGLPSNLTPAISQAFTAVVVSVAGTGIVVPPSFHGSGISHFEVLGDPSLNVATSDDSGGELFLAALAATSSSDTRYVATAPANQSEIELSFVLTPIAQSPL